MIMDKSYSEFAAGYGKIFEVLGDVAHDGVRQTPDIIIGKRTDPVYGDGLLIGRLVVDDTSPRNTNDVSAVFEFVYERAMLEAGNEIFYPRGYTHNNFSFLDEGYVWTEEDYFNATKALEEPINDAKSTQKMLFEALWNPELHPEFAA